MNTRTLLTPYFLAKPVAGFTELLRSEWTVNTPGPAAGDEVDRISAIHRPLADWIADTFRQGERPVSFAGDCCTAIPVLAGLQRANLDPGLIWFDAHGDFNTWETTPSGFLGGMPLAMMVGRGDQRMCEAVGLRPLGEDHIILTDARDLDPGEREAVAGSQMTHLRDVAALLDHPLPDRPIWVHFDADIVRPEDAPAMSYLAPGGPNAVTLREVFRRLAQTGRVVAVSVSAWNPELDSDGKSRDVCMALLDTLLGE